MSQESIWNRCAFAFAQCKCNLSSFVNGHPCLLNWFLFWHTIDCYQRKKTTKFLGRKGQMRASICLWFAHPTVSSDPSLYSLLLWLRLQPTKRRLNREKSLFLSLMKAYLHIPSPCSSMSPSNFIIVSMETDRLADRMGFEPILTIIIHTMEIWRRH